VEVRRFGPMVIAVVLFAVTIFFMRPLTESIVDKTVLKKRENVEAIGLNPEPEVLYGSILQTKAIKTQGIVPIYGSSELGTGFEFNPTKVFANKPTGFTPFIIGRGSVQSLVNVLNLAAQDDLKDKKLVFTFSPDWFAAKNGLASERLAMNSSALHVYQIILNPKISQDLKKEIAHRILEIPEVIKDYPDLKRLLETYESEDWASKTKRIGLWPLAEVKLAALEIQDARHVLPLLEKAKHKAKAYPESAMDSNRAWDKLLDRSVHRGHELITNDLNILDSSYASHTEAGKKGSWKNLKLYPSKEYQDFELLLRILEEKGADPLFVLIPANGRWADYADFPVSERKDYYHRIQGLIQEHGFHIADFSDKEYDLYFMQDPWHIGLKGWVEVNKAIDDFVHS
jgi:D-alanine transfer protein